MLDSYVIICVSCPHLHPHQHQTLNDGSTLSVSWAVALLEERMTHWRQSRIGTVIADVALTKQIEISATVQCSIESNTGFVQNGRSRLTISLFSQYRFTHLGWYAYRLASSYFDSTSSDRTTIFQFPYFFCRIEKVIIGNSLVYSNLSSLIHITDINFRTTDDRQNASERQISTVHE